MADPLRLVFMGSDPVALPLLDWLAGEGRDWVSLVGVFTGPDRASGRGQAVRPNAVKAWTLGRSLTVHQPEKLGTVERSALAALEPDLVLVVAYGQILKDELISVPRLGTLNLHASLLPRHRGASPYQTAVALGDLETGMALMRIVRELDAGPVADVERVRIEPGDTALEVEAKLASAAVPLVARNLPRLAAGELTFVEQDSVQATFCRRLHKSDGVLDFNFPANVLAARINGLNPWPSVAVDLAGVPVKFGRALAERTSAPGTPGTVLPGDLSALRVATADGVLRVMCLQRPGGRMLGAPEFLRGFPVPAGLVLPSVPMPELSSRTPFRR